MTLGINQSSWGGGGVGKMFQCCLFNPIHTDIFHNLFTPCGLINDPMYIFEDFPIKVKFLLKYIYFVNHIKVSGCKIRLFT